MKRRRRRRLIVVSQYRDDDPIAACNAYIASNPEALKDAYWKVSGVYVYQRQLFYGTLDISRINTIFEKTDGLRRTNGNVDHVRNFILRASKFKLSLIIWMQVARIEHICSIAERGCSQ